MATKRQEFFSVKHLMCILFILMLHGFSYCHGLQVNQAGWLRSLARSKLRAYDKSDDEWQVSELGHQESFNIGNMEDDFIEGLPGQPAGVTFNQYAGYVTVDKSKGRSLFYYFVEASHDPASKPLLLWLNGGPGCSSLGIGAMLEIGPFGVKPDGKTLYLRRYGWNNAANTLFVESPAGVGFSYSNTTSDYRMSGDRRTAEDGHTFLVSWFKRFPHYKAADFYVMGESYAGHYIPELADTIIKKNKEIDPSSVIHLKGLMIGNGLMNEATDNRGTFDYFWSHALISDETHRGLIEHCKNLTDPLCNDFEVKMDEEAGSINYYNIYAPSCPDDSLSLSKKENGHAGYDPCEGDYVFKYLNLPQVQEVLHANKTKLPYAWESCSDLIISWKDSPSTMFPIYKRLFSSGLRILLYTGDMDSVVSVSGTRYSIAALNLKVKKPWHPWYAGGQVAGYRVVYEGLTFATVRGAGHEVPTYQPRRAFALLKSFLAGN